jgi:FtsH-binding integral membrane protein
MRRAIISFTSEIEIMSYSENPYQQNPYASFGDIAAQANVDERTDFIRKTYLHLAGAVLAFIGIEAVLLNLPFVPDLVNTMIGQRYSWLVVIGLFVGVSYLANNWARSATSVGMQYAGLALYVVAESIVFLPLLYIAGQFGPPNVIPQAAMVTAVMFGGLTVIVFVTGHDFSYLRGILMICGLAALGLVIWGVFAQHSFGIPFSIAMIAFACGYILYDTSNVMRHYRVGQHVAASLALFASVALLFWYVLQLLMQLNRR